MRKKITYLLGAGASADALPLGNDLHKSLMTLADKIRGFENNDFNYLVEDLKWLSIKAMEFMSVDAFARFVYFHSFEKNKSLNLGSLEEEIDLSLEYRRIKDTLNAFFIIYQYKKVDRRYNHWLSHLIVDIGISQYSLKENIKIFSWNYDNQLEIAFSKHYPNSKTKDVHSILASHPAAIFSGDKNFHHDYNRPSLHDRRISVYHLNGVAGFHEDGPKHFQMVDVINSKSELEIIQDSLAVYDSKNSYLSFAWEKKNQDDLDIAITKFEETEMLIVIGYSLPEFNAEIDRKVFSSFKHLKTVIFQNNNIKEADIKVRLKNRGILPHVEIKFEENVEKFYIPDDFTLN